MPTSIKKIRLKKKTRTTFQAAEPTSRVRVLSLTELKKMDGYIHSNLDNFLASYKNFRSSDLIKLLTKAREQLVLKNELACQKLKEERKAMEDIVQINAQILKDAILAENKPWLDLKQEIDALLSSKTIEGVKDWTLEKSHKLGENINALQRLFDDVEKLSNATGLQTYISQKAQLERDFAEWEAEVAFEPTQIGARARISRTTDQTYSGYMSLRLRQVLGWTLELAHTRALRKIAGTGLIFEASGSPKELADITVTVPQTKSVFGINIKSSAIEYKNQAKSHIIDPDIFFKDAGGFKTEAEKFHYVFWNTIALESFHIKGRQDIKMLENVKKMGWRFGAEMARIYQLMYLYSVMVTHEQNINKMHLYDILAETFPTATPDKPIKNYYIVTPTDVMATDDIYSSLIHRYKTLPLTATEDDTWFNVAGFWTEKDYQISLPFTRMRAFYKRKSEFINEKVKKNKEEGKKGAYITYTDLYHDPEIGDTIREIYKNFDITKSRKIIFKVNFQEALRHGV